MVGPLSAIQIPSDINFPWSLAYISVWVYLGKIFRSQFVCSQHTAPRNIKLTQIPPSQDTNLHLSRVEPQKFISCAQRNSHQASVGLEPGISRLAVKRATTGPKCPFIVPVYCSQLLNSKGLCEQMDRRQMEKGTKW